MVVKGMCISSIYLSIPERNKLSLLIQAEIPDLLEVHAEAEEEALLELHDDEVVVVEEGTDTRIELYKQSETYLCTVHPRLLSQSIFISYNS